MLELCLDVGIIITPVGNGDKGRESDGATASSARNGTVSPQGAKSASQKCTTAQ